MHRATMRSKLLIVIIQMVVIVVINLVATISRAQSMTTSPIRTPYGTVPGQTIRTFRPAYSRKWPDAKNKNNIIFELEVMMPDSTTVSLSGKFKAENNTYYLDGSKSKRFDRIYPTDTKSIICLDYQVKGIAADSCWLFICEIGAINCYAKMPGDKVGSSVAIQKGGTDQPIVPLTANFVKEFTQDLEDDKLKDLLQRGFLLKAVLRYNKLKLNQ